MRCLLGEAVRYWGVGWGGGVGLKGMHFVVDWGVGWEWVRYIHKMMKKKGIQSRQVGIGHRVVWRTWDCFSSYSIEV